MARTDNINNVVVIVAQDPAGGATSWKARGVEVQTDGTLALGTAATGASQDQALTALAATYNQNDIARVVHVHKPV